MASPSTTSKPPEAVADARATVQALEERLRAAMVASNVEALDQLLADDLVFTTFLGEAISKADDLNAHRSGAFRIHGIDLQDMVLRPAAGVVVM